MASPSLINPNPHTHSSSYWSTIDSEIDINLKKTIAKIPSPNVITNPMHQLTFAAPPTTAPALCIAAYELVGRDEGHRHHAVAAASALKLMHSAAHAHNQLRTSTSNSTDQMLINPNIKLLIGDGMVPFGFELLARSCDEGPQTESAGRVLHVMQEISRVIGSQGIIGGKYHEMHACGAACGAILGGGKEEEIERLRKYGFYIGMLGMMTIAKEKWEIIEKTRELAIKQLDIFPSEQGRDIASLVESHRLVVIE